MGINKPRFYYLLQEDGSRIALEDSSGFILLEDQVIGCTTASPWMSRALMILMFIFVFSGLHL